MTTQLDHCPWCHAFVPFDCKNFVSFMKDHRRPDDRICRKGKMRASLFSADGTVRS